MDINRSKQAIISLFMITIFFWFLPLSLHAASRGITIKAKTPSGAVKEIQLYSGYHALVVGVSDYDIWPDLPYATKDAQDVARTLKKMGFKVTTVINPSSSELNEALNDMAYKYGLESNRAILFYYAGHGETEKLADGTKLGYIIPKDCPLLRDDPIGFVNKAISMKDIEAYSLRIRSKHVLMLFDSCFSGSLFSLARAVPEDITEKSTLPVRQYITAGTEDEAVPDRSMFKRCLLLGLDGDADLTRDGYITGTELGLYLHDKVIQNTRRAQHPQYGKIRTPELARGDFIFLLASSGAVIEKPAPVSSKAYLSVESNVSAARVLVDGRYVGTTNLSDVEITSGEHRIQVEKVGYEPYVRKIRFVKGRTRDLYVILDPKAHLKGSLYVDTQPDNARVRILNIDRAFNQGIELKPGSYHLEVSAKGYETKKVWINIDEGEDKNVTIYLSSLLSIDQQKIPIAISMLNIINDNFCDINIETNKLKELSNNLSNTLENTGKFQVLNQQDVLLMESKDNGIISSQINFDNWRSIGAHFLIKGRVCIEKSWSSNDIILIELRLYDTFKKSLIAGKRYKGEEKDRQRMVLQFCEKVERTANKADNPLIEPEIEPENLYRSVKKLYDQGDLKTAREGFQKLLKEFPKSKNADNAQFWIGESYYREKWYEKAILEYQKVIEKYPKGDKVTASLLKQGFAFFNLEDKSNAHLVLSELIEKYPESNEA
ncbi:MAG: tol-pal system protein YbgF, partial [Proteobacteria bacterium]|nr:tol-pal system protein YbgF [Pseudomonadota bacterium]